MKKTFKMMAAVLLAVLAAAPFGGFAPSAEAAQTAKPVVKSHTYKQVKQLTYPEVTNTGNASFEKKINQDFKRYIDHSYQEYVKNKKDGEKQGYKAEYQTDFKVKYNQDGKLSIQTENYSYTGGAHGMTSVQTFNYDLAAKKQVALSDVLNTKTKVNKTRDYLYGYIKKHDDLFDQDVKKQEITLNNERPFFFTKNGIAVVFGQYDLGPYAAGIRDVSVPASVYQ
ncbi:hypothetical protein D2M30_4089 [Bacillus amyloliquefaciens]|uniref:DUF3298 and DUF4163 domain-containing protein n=1 Tax=Bacillus amyloliquefaciens TaxID=1390 RepID=UPI000F63A7C7|nr:DUF3298 and DUF4163 domain-containing protein [Bacillus amyloliquefaciens]QBG58388.1 hypothetical protein D2M30_4089 [Bacillus amyloliquefaciens]